MVPRLALLIDAENIASTHWPRIDTECRALGRRTVQRLFGDFTEVRLSGWLEIGRRYGLEAVMQLNGGRGKNSADIALTIHAMDLLHGGAVDGFCLVSSDRDFLPLATRLIGAGKAVHVLCRAADERLRMGLNSVIELDPPPSVATVVQVTPPAAIAPPKPKDPPLVAAYKKVSNGAPDMLFSEFVRKVRAINRDLIDKQGNGTALQNVLDTGYFDRIGAGGDTRIAVKRR